MFGKKSHGDVKKSAQKILDPKKDHVTRLKHLRIVLESYEVSEAKCFFEQHYSFVYFLFHEGFTNVEASLGQRANKAHREELDYMLFILEKILTLLPEMIHKRWQMHSIGRIMKKLLHSGNSLKLRREGIRLFLLWYEILMDNSTEDCHKMFKNLIPKLSSSSSLSLDSDFFIVRTFPNSKVTVPDNYPILPAQAGEKQPDNLSKWLLEGLLSYIVSEVSKIQWSNSELHEYCFNFLFDKFKEHYIPQIFPELNKNYSIYEPCLDLPKRRLYNAGGQCLTQVLCQETVVKWIANYTMTTVMPSSNSQNIADKSESVDLIENGGQASQEIEIPIPGSNASTLSTASSYMENCSNGSSSCSDEHTFSEHEIVRTVLYSSRENINIIHEIFRQAFLFPFHHGGIVRRVIGVYRSWFQSDVMPVFMQDPSRSLSISGICGKGGENEVESRRRQSVSSSSGSQLVYVHGGESTSTSSEDQMTDDNIKAGLQKVLQIFITNSANLFLLETIAGQQQPFNADLQLQLEDQVDMCRRVLNIYRFIVMKIHLDMTTWEQLLLVLLRITSVVMTIVLPLHNEMSLSGRLAEPIFKTLILTWIKANLNVLVSEELWKQFLQTLSSLTNWVQLIREWSKTMDMLTRVLARYIYGLDLRDLPLDKLSEQKVKRLHGVKTGSVKVRDKSLMSRNWMKQMINDENGKPFYMPSSSLLAAAATSTASGTALKQITSLASSLATGRHLGGSSSHGMNVVGKKTSIRQRSQSGESSPPVVCQSQLDLTSNSFIKSNSNSFINSLLTRSSSDSSIMIDPSKVKVSGLCLNAVENMEVPSAGAAATEATGDGGEEGEEEEDEEDSSRRDQHYDEMPLPSDKRMSTDNQLHVTDSTSVTSTDSNVVHQYHMILNQSIDGNERNSSYSDRSDTEVLLQVSDSGSGRSGQSERHLMKTTKEDSPPTRKKAEEAIRQGGGNGVDESLDDDTEEDEVTVHSFEEKQTKDMNDRDSLRIDDNEALTDLNIDISKSSGKLSILGGGVVTGWTPDVAIVLWRRMLGSLGNVNEIKNSDMHFHVYEYFCDLMDIFIKIRNNLGVTKDNQTTPDPPSLVPPILLLAPWLFEAVGLPDDYKQGKLLAYQLLCIGTLRCHDIPFSSDHLHRFYMMLHNGLVHSNQDVTNVLIRHCNSKFFSLPLSGSTLMILDFIHGANRVLSNTTNCPRAEAMSLLGSLLCFPNHLKEILVLEPNSKELTVIKCTDVKDHIINILLKFARKEPSGLSRCIGLSCLGLFLYEELCHQTLHPKLKDVISVLLSSLRLYDTVACQVAAHILTLLCDHMPLFLLKLPEMPRKIVEDMTVTITLLLSSTEKTNSKESRKTASQVLVSVMFTLLEWCMRLPLSFLLSSSASGRRCLLHLVFDVLNMVVSGCNKLSDQPERKMATDVDADPPSAAPLQISQSVPSTPSSITLDISSDVQTTAAAAAATFDGNASQKDKASISSPSRENADNADNFGLKLAARTIMLHLINYLSVFPMSSDGSSQLNSEVMEHNDSKLEDLNTIDLQPQILKAPNTQFFVINNMTLMSFVELPVQRMVVEGGYGVTTDDGKISTEKTVCRVIIRGPSGKHCWDSSILYGSPNCRSGSYPADPAVLLHIVEDEDMIDTLQSKTTTEKKQLITLPPIELPTVSNISHEEDALNMMLRYLGKSSPECLLHTGEELNSPFHSPPQLSQNTEEDTKQVLLQQQIEESKHALMHRSDRSSTCQPMKPMDKCDPASPFHLCRLFFSQMGFMVWEKRKPFDLLHKSEKLLRELKHLDNQRCRETHKIAMIYVAPGQEDKVSILTNVAGSQSFEELVKAVGCQVDLETHSGFMGGLQRNKMTGSTAPYYATSTMEVIFHVSTQMPSETEEDQLRKLKHLGNDEVHIIWSEHSRDYRHGIIPTEFGDVLIIIYPLHNGLFRIQIKRRPEVPYFGPLFDGAIVDFQVLPGLVRATAINAGQMLRTLKSHYQTFYEERMRYIDNIVQKYKLLTMFETFSSQIYSTLDQPGYENLMGQQSISTDTILLPPQLSKVAKEDASSAVHRKLSLVGGKTKKSKKLQSSQSSTPPRSPSLDMRHVK